jgi:hypothetical protein
MLRHCRSGSSRICRITGSQGTDREICQRMAFYLEGKITVDANHLSLKEATEISRDIKFMTGETRWDEFYMPFLAQRRMKTS